MRHLRNGTFRQFGYSELLCPICWDSIQPNECLRAPSPSQGEGSPILSPKAGSLSGTVIQRTQQLDDLIKEMALPNWFPKQIPRHTPGAAGHDLEGLQFCPEGGRRKPLKQASPQAPVFLSSFAPVSLICPHACSSPPSWPWGEASIKTHHLFCLLLPDLNFLCKIWLAGETGVVQGPETTNMVNYFFSNIGSGAKYYTWPLSCCTTPHPASHGWVQIQKQSLVLRCLNQARSSYSFYRGSGLPSV